MKGAKSEMAAEINKTLPMEPEASPTSGITFASGRKRDFRSQVMATVAKQHGTTNC